MGDQVHLLSSLPKTKRDVTARVAVKSPEVIATAKLYGAEYFDGDRKYGYGGYNYDGRWRPVARDIAKHYRIDGHRVLDIGCAKGYLVYEMLLWGNAFGLDISRYAVTQTPHSGLVGRLHLGTADDLPFPDKSFELVLSINTLHNLPYPRLIKALREIQRVSSRRAFVQVDSYRTPEEQALFMDWVLTAEWHGYPNDWRALFDEAGYTGDYDFTYV